MKPVLSLLPSLKPAPALRIACDIYARSFPQPTSMAVIGPIVGIPSWRRVLHRGGSLNPSIEMQGSARKPDCGSQPAFTGKRACSSPPIAP